MAARKLLVDHHRAGSNGQRRTLIASLEMARKTNKQGPSGPPPEAFEGLDQWAAQVVEAVSTAELDLLMAGYRKLARDRELSPDERRLARKQAEALKAAAPARDA